MRITISSGHSLYVRGASGILDEVNEARRVVDRVAGELRARGVDMKAFHDNTSHSQNENLNTLVDWHNSLPCDLALSIHFNAYVETAKPMGVEVLYVTQNALASQVSAAIAACGFIDRGAKKRTDLFFLNNAEMPAILIEVCFVDSEADAEIYNDNFLNICDAIADVLGDEGDIAGETPPPYRRRRCSRPPARAQASADRTMKACRRARSWPSFMKWIRRRTCSCRTSPKAPAGSARRLNPYVHYVACRWNYNVTSRDMLLDKVALVRAPATGIALTAFPADWGPHENTGRVADLSPGLLADLGIETDDEVEVRFPG